MKIDDIRDLLDYAAETSDRETAAEYAVVALNGATCAWVLRTDAEHDICNRLANRARRLVSRIGAILRQDDNGHYSWT